MCMSVQNVTEIHLDAMKRNVIHYRGDVMLLLTVLMVQMNIYAVSDKPLRQKINLISF